MTYFSDIIIPHAALFVKYNLLKMYILNTIKYKNESDLLSDSPKFLKNHILTPYFCVYFSKKAIMNTRISASTGSIMRFFISRAGRSAINVSP